MIPLVGKPLFCLLRNGFLCGSTMLFPGMVHDSMCAVCHHAKIFNSVVILDSVQMMDATTIRNRNPGFPFKYKDVFKHISPAVCSAMIRLKNKGVAP